MDLGTDLDQALEGNVLFAVKFETVWNLAYRLPQLLNNYAGYPRCSHLLYKAKTTFNRYLDSHPSVCDTVVAYEQYVVWRKRENWQ